MQQEKWIIYKKYSDVEIQFLLFQNKFKIRNTK